MIADTTRAAFNVRSALALISLVSGALNFPTAPQPYLPPRSKSCLQLKSN